MALRRAQLWIECLDDENESLVIDNGQHDGVEYQILMFGQDECVFQSAADLPTPCHKDHVTKDKDVAKMIVNEKISKEGEAASRLKHAQ